MRGLASLARQVSRTCRSCDGTSARSLSGQPEHAQGNGKKNEENNKKEKEKEKLVLDRGKRGEGRHFDVCSFEACPCNVEFIA